MNKNLLILTLVCFLSFFGKLVVYADITPLSVPLWDSNNGPFIVFSPREIALYWTPSTNDTGVAGYYIYRCTGTNCTFSSQPTLEVNNPNASFYADGTVSPGTTYSYAIAAYDAAGNISAKSSIIIASTKEKSSTSSS